MPEPSSFDYAIIRVVPRPEREEFINVGVILFSRTQRFLAARVALDGRRLTALDPRLDVDEIERHLALIPLLCAGDPAAGPMSQLSQAERFHWLVAPCSTVIQTSPTHSGLTRDPQAELDRLMARMVELPGALAEPRSLMRGMRE